MTNATIVTGVKTFTVTVRTSESKTEYTVRAYRASEAIQTVRSTYRLPWSDKAVKVTAR